MDKVNIIAKYVSNQNLAISNLNVPILWFLLNCYGQSEIIWVSLVPIPHKIPHDVVLTVHQKLGLQILATNNASELSDVSLTLREIMDTSKGFENWNNKKVQYGV